MNALMLDLHAELTEFAAIAAESIGWQPLGDSAYLHLGKPEEEEIVITVVGVPEAVLQKAESILPILFIFRQQRPRLPPSYLDFPYRCFCSKGSGCIH